MGNYASAESPFVSGGSTDIDDLLSRDYELSVSYKSKEELIKKLTDVVMKALKQKKSFSSPEDRVAYLAKSVPNPRKNRKSIAANASLQKGVCESVAKSVNKELGDIIDMKQSGNAICDQVGDIIQSLGAGLRKEYVSIAASATRNLQNMKELETLLKASYGKMMEEASKTTDDTLKVKLPAIKSMHDLILKELRRQIQILSNLIGTTLKPTEKNLQKLLAENKSYKGLVSSIKKSMGTSEWGDKLSFWLSGMNNVAQMALMVRKSLQDIGMSVNTYKANPKWSDLMMEFQNTLETASKNKTISKKYLDNYSKAKRILQKFHGRHSEISRAMSGAGQTSGAAEAWQHMSDAATTEMFGGNISTGGDPFSGYEDEPDQEDYTGSCDEKYGAADPSSYLGGLASYELANQALAEAETFVGGSSASEFEYMTGGDNAMDVLPTGASEHGDQPSKQGGLSKPGLGLKKKLRTTKMTRNALLKDFKDKARILTDRMYQSIAQAARGLKSSDLTPEMYRFKTTLDEMVSLFRDGIEYALTGYYVHANSTEVKFRFVGLLNSMSQALESIPGSHFRDIKYNVDGFIKLIDFFSDKFQIYYDRGEGSVFGGVEGGRVFRAAITLRSARNTFNHFFNVAKFRHNLKHVSGEMSKYNKDYTTLVGRAVAARMDIVKGEYKEFEKALENNDVFDKLSNLNPDEKTALENEGFDIDCYTKEHILALQKSFCDAKITLYKVAQAVDQYLMLFTDGVVASPDDIREVSKLLDSVEIMADWFSNKSGDAMASLYELFPWIMVGFKVYHNDCLEKQVAGDFKDGIMRTTISGSSHYYEEIKKCVNKDKTAAFSNGGALKANNPLENENTVKMPANPFLPIDPKRALKVHKFAKYAVSKVYVLKNIVSAFAYLGDKLGGSSISSKVFFSPNEIYEKLCEYIYISSLTMGWGEDKQTSTDIKIKKHGTNKQVELYDDDDIKTKLSTGVIGGATTIPSLANNVNKFIRAPFITTNIRDNRNDALNELVSDIKNANITDPSKKAAGNVRWEFAVAMNSILREPDKSYSGWRNIFVHEDKLFVTIIKAMTAKVFTVTGLYNMLNFHSRYSHSLSPTRLILGGAVQQPPSDGVTPVIYEEALEIYARLPLLVEFYKDVFCFDEKCDSKPEAVPNTDLGWIISMAPEVGSIWSPLLRCIFDQPRNDGSYTENQLKKIIHECNRIYHAYKNKGGNVAITVFSEFVAEINQRYGLMNRSETKEYMLNERAHRRKAAMDGENSYEDIDDYNTLDSDVRGDGVAPSDRFGEYISEYKDSKLKWDPNMFKALEHFRKRIDTIISDVTKRKPEHPGTQNYPESHDFSLQIHSAKRTLKGMSKSEDRYSLARHLITGMDVRQTKDVEAHLMFHELVVSPLQALSSLYDLLSRYEQDAHCWDAYPLWLAIQELDNNNMANWDDNKKNNTKFKEKLKDHIFNDDDQTKLTSNLLRRDIQELPKGYMGLEIRSKVQDIIRSWDYTSSKTLTIKTGTKEGKRWSTPHEYSSRKREAATLLIWWERLFKKMTAMVYSLTSSLGQLVQYRTQNGKLSIDHTKLQSLIEDMLSNTRASLNKFRGIIPDSVIRKYEVGSEPGSIGWLHEHLITAMFYNKEEGYRGLDSANQVVSRNFMMLSNRNPGKPTQYLNPFDLSGDWYTVGTYNNIITDVANTSAAAADAKAAAADATAAAAAADAKAAAAAKQANNDATTADNEVTTALTAFNTAATAANAVAAAAADVNAAKAAAIDLNNKIIDANDKATAAKAAAAKAKAAAAAKAAVTKSAAAAAAAATKNDIVDAINALKYTNIGGGWNSDSNIPGLFCNTVNETERKIGWSIETAFAEETHYCSLTSHLTDGTGVDVLKTQAAVYPSQSFGSTGSLEGVWTANDSLAHLFQDAKFGKERKYSNAAFMSRLDYWLQRGAGGHKDFGFRGDTHVDGDVTRQAYKDDGTRNDIKRSKKDIGEGLMMKFNEVMAAYLECAWDVSSSKMYAPLISGVANGPFKDDVFKALGWPDIVSPIMSSFYAADIVKGINYNNTYDKPPRQLENKDSPIGGHVIYPGEIVLRQMYYGKGPSNVQGQIIINNDGVDDKRTDTNDRHTRLGDLIGKLIIAVVKKNKELHYMNIKNMIRFMRRKAHVLLQTISSSTKKTETKGDLDSIINKVESNMQALGKMATPFSPLASLCAIAKLKTLWSIIPGPGVINDVNIMNALLEYKDDDKHLGKTLGYNKYTYDPADPSDPDFSSRFVPVRSSGSLGDPTKVLFASLSKVMRTALSESGRSNDKFNLIQNLAEVPERMKTSFKTNLPIFKCLFTMCAKKASLLKNLMRLGIGIDRPQYDSEITPKPMTGLPGVHGDLMAYDAKTLSKSHTYYNGMLDKIISGCNAAVSACKSVLGELGDSPMYLEVSENSIADYKNMNGKLPYMPLSSLSVVTKPPAYKNIGSDPSQGLNNDRGLQIHYRHPGLAYPGQSDELEQFNYGTRGLLHDYGTHVMLERMPCMSELLEQYNKVSAANKRFEEVTYSKMLIRIVHAYRYLTGTKLYAPLFGADRTIVDINMFRVADAYKTRSHGSVSSECECILSNPTYQSIVQINSVVQMTSDPNSESQQNIVVKHVAERKQIELGYNRRATQVHNLLDLNISPINFHALRREIPLVNLYNYAFTFDSFVSQILQSAVNETELVDYPDQKLLSPKDVLCALLKKPYSPMSKELYEGRFGAIVRGGTNIDSYGYPRYIADQLWNKVLLNEVWAGGISEDVVPNVGHSVHRPGYELDSMVRHEDPRQVVNTLHYLKQSDRYDSKNNTAVVKFEYKNDNKALENVTSYIRRLGQVRFDTTLARNMVFLANVQRLIQYKLNHELNQMNFPVVSSNEVTNPSITQYQGVETVNDLRIE